jgi:hypothetical protein
MSDLIAADFGIRQCNARFADAVWRQDATTFASCFAETGEWKIAGFHFSGRAEVEKAFGQLVGRCSRVHLVTGQPLLTRQADEVLGRHSMTEFAWMPDGTQFMTVGMYHDRYVEEAGEWLFRERFWSFKYRGPIDLSESLADTSDYGPFPARPEPDEATYVRKA